jgi:hypothetical protein
MVGGVGGDVKNPNCITENLNETESLRHRENLNHDRLLAEGALSARCL